jgi:hypothetical protein
LCLISTLCYYTHFTLFVSLITRAAMVTAIVVPFHRVSFLNPSLLHSFHLARFSNNVAMVAGNSCAISSHFISLKPSLLHLFHLARFSNNSVGDGGGNSISSHLSNLSYYTHFTLLVSNNSGSDGDGNSCARFSDNSGSDGGGNSCAISSHLIAQTVATTLILPCSFL